MEAPCLKIQPWVRVSHSYQCTWSGVCGAVVIETSLKFLFFHTYLGVWKLLYGNTTCNDGTLLTWEKGNMQYLLSVQYKGPIFLSSHTILTKFTLVCLLLEVDATNDSLLRQTALFFNVLLVQFSYSFLSVFALKKYPFYCTSSLISWFTLFGY